MIFNMIRENHTLQILFDVLTLFMMDLFGDEEDGGGGGFPP